jgi:hypothetical protein
VNLEIDELEMRRDEFSRLSDRTVQVLWGIDSLGLFVDRTGQDRGRGG